MYLNIVHNSPQPRIKALSQITWRKYLEDGLG